jgi:hypothetical protein
MSYPPPFCSSFTRKDRRQQFPFFSSFHFTTTFFFFLFFFLFLFLPFYNNFNPNSFFSCFQVVEVENMETWLFFRISFFQKSVFKYFSKEGYLEKLLSKNIFCISLSNIDFRIMFFRITFFQKYNFL